MAEAPKRLPDRKGKMSLQSRRWTGTWFTQAGLDADPGSGILDFASYYVGAIEYAPTTGKEHVQFYLFLKKKKTLKGTVDLLQALGWVGVRIFASRGDHASNITYVVGPYEKEGKIKPARTDFIEYGDRPSDDTDHSREKWQRTLELAQAGKFSEIDACIQVTQFRNLRYVYADTNRAKDLDSPCGVWIHGASGVGKSTLARSYGPSFDKDCNRWWCGYRNEPIVIIDDMGPDDVRGMDRYLKIWSDKFAFSPEIKGNHLGKIRPERLIVTSQYRIEDLFKDPETIAALKRRFEVIHIYYDDASNRIIDRTPRNDAIAAQVAELPPQPVVESADVDMGVAEWPVEPLDESLWDSEFALLE